MTAPRATNTTDVGELLEAAQGLLSKGGHLDAIRVLHCEIGVALGQVDPITRECTASDVRLEQRRLSEEYAKLTGTRRRSSIASLLNRRPHWTGSAVALVIFVGLS